nr:hypothetical protein [Tanacetum cinerariifolium]
MGVKRFDGPNGGHHVFLANITTKTIKDKSKEKQLEDVLIVRDFSKVFPEDLPVGKVHELQVLLRELSRFEILLGELGLRFDVDDVAVIDVNVVE